MGKDVAPLVSSAVVYRCCRPRLILFLSRYIKQQDSAFTLLLLTSAMRVNKQRAKGRSSPEKKRGGGGGRRNGERPRQCPDHGQSSEPMIRDNGGKQEIIKKPEQRQYMEHGCCVFVL